jgi:hypothetical protein
MLKLKLSWLQEVLRGAAQSGGIPGVESAKSLSFGVEVGVGVARHTIQ